VRFDKVIKRMPSIPSAAAFKKLGMLHQLALQAATPAEITIAGVKILCSGDLGPVEFIPTDGGSARGQRLVLDVAKSVLATPPRQKTLVTHDGVEFKVTEVSGGNAHDVAWHIECLRWID
jgi:hypothetical protein